MSEYDLHSNIDDRVALIHTVIISNTTIIGNIIDTSGFESIEFVVQSEIILDGNYAILLEESDDVTMPVSLTMLVSADETLGSLTGFASGDNNIVIQVGSIGKKRYQRLSLVSTNVVGGGDFSGTVILGHPHTVPISQ